MSKEGVWGQPQRPCGGEEIELSMEDDDPAESGETLEPA